MFGAVDYLSAIQAGLLTAIARNNILLGDRPINPGDLVSLGELGEAYEVTIPAGRPAAIEIFSAVAGEPTDLNGDGVTERRRMQASESGCGIERR